MNEHQAYVLTCNGFAQHPVKLAAVLQSAHDDELAGSLRPDQSHHLVGATTRVRLGDILRFVEDREDHRRRAAGMSGHRLPEHERTPGGGIVARPEYGPAWGTGKSVRKFAARAAVVGTSGCAYCG